MWDIVSVSSVVLAGLAVVLTYLNYKILVITKEMLCVTVDIKYRTDELLRVTKKTYTSLSGELDK
tara:strand:+ start:554 stop:748 length:195 start_codon:yes stop_codon:yes gene_type:complete